MKYVLNHIIRSLSNDAIVEDLQKRLLGKTLSFPSQTILVRHIELVRNSLFFYHKDGAEVVHGIKKIVHDQNTSSIRLYTQRQTVVFSYNQKENVSI